MDLLNVSRVRAVKKNLVSEPCAQYDSLLPLWERSRAIIRGQRYAKEYDSIPAAALNLLIPFSPSMSLEQYNFYKSEAELPGIVSQFTKMIVGGLLRKKPKIELSERCPAEALDWLLNDIAEDGGSMVTLLDNALFEEMQTSRAWIYVEYPRIDQEAVKDFTAENWKAIKPYPVAWKAENVINWQTAKDKFGRHSLSRIFVRGFEAKLADGAFHPDLLDTVWLHEIVEGKYQIRKFQVTRAASPEVTSGHIQQDQHYAGFEELTDELVVPLMFDEPMSFIPAWPLNGSIEPSEPMIIPFVDKEVALYNKISRRNHLLYGAATYTPWIASDMADTAFDEIVNSGLGSWIKLNREDTIGVLDTPTAALTDMDRAIAAGIEEMARMGIRMLAPETEQSGIALEIRNAAQTAQLGTLNTKVSATMQQVCVHLLNRRYSGISNVVFDTTDVQFNLSADFDPVPIGADWLRLATEWLQGGLIPRSAWIYLLRSNDLLPEDYDDDAAKEEVMEDEIIQATPQQQEDGMDTASSMK